jgi:tRNA dimethylallyltransferase
MGPTGSGKTAAALRLAREFPVTVINADSRQVYADFPIITAQPSPEERACCPHLLYGFLPTDQKLGAGAYARLARETIDDVLLAGRVPVLVGGTGLYFRALLEGLADIPDVPEEVSRAWQERCERQGSQALHALLAERDPAYAAKIHPNDRQRITRALEVLEHTGQTFSWWHSRPMPESPYRACKIGFGLHMLTGENRLAERIEAMLAAGALEEARAALGKASGGHDHEEGTPQEARVALGERPDLNAPGWSGIGCAELRDYLLGKISFDECRELWLKNTRAYAKRQLTWFRADRDIRWFGANELDAMSAYVGECRL